MISLSQAVNSAYAIGSNIMSLFGSNDDAAATAARQYNYQRALNQQAYDLTQQGYREGPSNQRKGLEAAGYNPILAISNGLSNAQFSGGSAGMGTNDTVSSRGSMISNALKYAMSERDLLASQTRATNAGRELTLEQAETERRKQENFQFQNAMLDVQKHLYDKDLSNYERKMYMDLYEKFQRAENYRSEAYLMKYNATTGRMTAQANHLNALGNYYYNTHRALGKTESKSYSANALKYLGGSYSSSQTK